MTDITTHNMPLTAKDFDSGAEVKWCPGCGDYAILKQVQNVMARREVAREKIVFVSGIGCSGRFPYYMNTYGLHTIHGRALPIASGIKISRPDLSVWVVTGDGDGFSIGLSHTLHALRRNFDLNVLCFNNQIYGLTKGQYSPTSELGKKTASTPMGSLDEPFNPTQLALAAEATFVARSIDRKGLHLQEIMMRAADHKGTSFVEIYQNCNIFNDKAFEVFVDKDAAEHVVYVEQGKPLLFGANKEKGILLDGYKARMVDLEKDGYSATDLWIHDENDLYKAQMLARFSVEKHDGYAALPRPFGVFFKRENRATYEDLLHAQIKKAIEKNGAGDLDVLIRGTDFWTVS